MVNDSSVTNVANNTLVADKLNLLTMNHPKPCRLNG